MVPFLVAMMLLTGVCNTLLSKYQVRSESVEYNLNTETDTWQDLQCVANCDSDDPKEIRRFSMPVMQTYNARSNGLFVILTIS